MGTVLMLAFVVFTASALQLTMEQWQDFLFDKEEYINWYAIRVPPFLLYLL